MIIGTKTNASQTHDYYESVSLYFIPIVNVNDMGFYQGSLCLKFHEEIRLPMAEIYGFPDISEAQTQSHRCTNGMNSFWAEDFGLAYNLK